MTNKFNFLTIFILLYSINSFSVFEELSYEEWSKISKEEIFKNDKEIKSDAENTNLSRFIPNINNIKIEKLFVIILYKIDDQHYTRFFSCDKNNLKAENIKEIQDLIGHNIIETYWSYTQPNPLFENNDKIEIVIS